MYEELMELQKFRKNKRKVFVDFVNGLVKWKNDTYKLKYIKVGEKNYPYVVIEAIKPLSEILMEIESVNHEDNKEELKFVEYEVNGNLYYVVGIGPVAIKAIKNDDEEPDFFYYTTTEGQYLLDELVSCLDGCVLNVNNEVKA